MANSNEKITVSITYDDELHSYSMSENAYKAIQWFINEFDNCFYAPILIHHVDNKIEELDI